MQANLEIYRRWIDKVDQFFRTEIGIPSNHVYYVQYPDMVRNKNGEVRLIKSYWFIMPTLMFCQIDATCPGAMKASDQEFRDFDIMAQQPAWKEIE